MNIQGEIFDPSDLQNYLVFKLHRVLAPGSSFWLENQNIVFLTVNIRHLKASQWEGADMWIFMLQ